MSFMEPEVYHGHFQIIRNTSDGDIVTPEECAEYRGNEEAAEAYGVSPDDVETVFGYGYRLQAPGYIDSTDWSIADTEAEAYAELLDMYGTDDGEREEWELEAIEIVIRDASPEKRQELAKWYGVDFDEESGVCEIPTGPDTDNGDYILSPCGSIGGKTRVSQYGRCLGEFAEESEARHFIRRHMQAERFWPNVWVESDHGNYHLTTIVE